MMSDEERKIIATLTEALPKMSDFNKGYLLGVGEAMANIRSEKKENVYNHLHPLIKS